MDTETMTTKPPSTSTNEPPNDGAIPSVGVRPRRINVRQKPSETLTAYQAIHEDSIILPSGLPRKVWPDEWVVCRGAMSIDVLPSAAFEKLYERVEVGLFLPDPIKARLEARLGIGASRNAEELTQAVDRLADIRIGQVRLDFTPGQYAELARKAEKNGITVAEEVERIVHHLAGELFWDA